MKNFVKHFVLFSLAVVCLTLFVGCESSTALHTASFTDISISGSKNYGVAVKFAEDKRLEEKYIDVQVKSDRKINDVTIWQDGGEKYTFNFEEPDTWKSITTILVNGKNEPDTEVFEKYTEATSRRYLFSGKEEFTLVFRVVAGESIDNNLGKGKVLVGSEAISDEFTLDIEGKDNNNIED